MGLRPPTRAHLISILKVVHSTSLRVEEGRPIRCSVSLADPAHPRYLLFASTRADVPQFSKLARRLPLTAANLVKLGRAMDPWATSIAVYIGNDGEPYVWGFVDQRVQFNTWMFAEIVGRPLQKDVEGQQPGLVTIEIDGVAQLSAYHETAFLGSLRYDSITKQHTDALSSLPVVTKIKSTMTALASDIRRHLPASARSGEILEAELIKRWQASIRRICSGVQRFETGGALIITSQPLWDELDGKNVRYKRVAEALPCSVLEDEYFSCVQANISPTDVPWHAFEKYVLASEDSRDRQEELTSTIRAIAGLARLDGAVVLRPDLSVEAFGVKIRSETKIGTVYTGSIKTASRSRFDTSHLGTRNLSAIRYCKDDQNAMVIVISQDGTVRVVTTWQRRVVAWNDVWVRNGDPDWRILRNLYDHVVGFQRLPERRGFTEVPKRVKGLSKGRYRGDLL